VKDIRFKDSEGCELGVDSYQADTARPGDDDYCFVLLTSDPTTGPSRMHTVGLSRAQALNLAKFLIEELSK
jgi:hypothetical protein